MQQVRDSLASLGEMSLANVVLYADSLRCAPRMYVFCRTKAEEPWCSGRRRSAAPPTYSSSRKKGVRTLSIAGDGARLLIARHGDNL